jgi:threonine dehydrogenase-like Zn-dependent dehydrogenase
MRAAIVVVDMDGVDRKAELPNLSVPVTLRSPRSALALRKTREGVRLLPHLHRQEVGPSDVEISVVCAGICRTDLHVATGRIAAARGRVLGHELSGVVTRIGAEVRRISPGDRVTVFPIIGCGRCAWCRAAASWHCPEATMLGVSRDGAFGDALVVPEHAVYTLPDGLSFARGAFAEPVAASLAVTRAPIAQGSTGVILGSGRIAELTRRVLATRDIVVPIHPVHAPLSPRSLDFVVETVATEAALAAALDALKPEGTLVLKSRPARTVPVDLARAVRREVRIVALSYGPFSEAIALLDRGGLEVDDLFGPAFALRDHEAAFRVAESDESQKVFLRPGAP